MIPCLHCGGNHTESWHHDHVRQPREPAPPTFTGTFRVYFNRHQAAPLVWCVATDDFELAVSAVDITAPVRTVYAAGKATPDHEDGKPSAWLEVTGTLILAASCARIVRSAE